MVAYIEFVIFDNFFITLIIGCATYRFLRLRASWRRLIFAAVLGTVAAVVFPIIAFNMVTSVIFKLALGVVLSAILFVKRYNLILGAAAFLVITFMFGGLLFFIGLMVHGDIESALTKPISGVPLFVFIAAPAILYLLTKKLFLKHHRTGDLVNNIMNVKIEIEGKSIEVKGFLDTGNRLYDTKTGLPVIILSFKALLPHLKDEELALFIGGKSEKLFPHAHYIYFSALGNEGDKILVLKPQKFTFYYNNKANILYDVMVGLSFSKITDSLDYSAILHPCLLEKLA